MLKLCRNLSLVIIVASGSAVSELQAAEAGDMMTWSGLGASVLLPLIILLSLILIFVVVLQRMRVKEFQQKVISSHDILEVTLQKAQREIEKVRQSCELVSLMYYEYDIETQSFTGDKSFFKFFVGELHNKLELNEVEAKLYAEDKELLKVYKDIKVDDSENNEVNGICRAFNARGELRYLRVYAKSLYSSTGAFLYHCGSMLDITESKQREQELLKVNKHMEYIQNMARIYSWEVSVKDPDFIRVSSNFTDFLGTEYRGKEYIQTSDLRDILADEDYNMIVSELNICMLSGKRFDIVLPMYPVGSSEVRYVRGISFSSAENPYVGDGIVAGVIQDITDLKNAERRAGHADKINALGRLASGVAHDFNNQLSGILGFAELIKSESNSSVIKEYVNKIIDRGEKSSGLVRKLLDFSKSQKEEAELIDVDDLINDTLSFFSQLLKKSTQIKKDVQETGLGILGNYNELQSAILNLAKNARDSLEDGVGEIIFRVKSELIFADVAKRLQVSPGKFVVVAVLDNGQGIAEEIRGKILEPFFTTKTAGKGAGLGLSTVHAAVVAMAGGMEIISEVGKGTEVRLYFPVASENCIFENITKTTEHRAKSKTDHILIIDDDRSLVKLVTMQLEKAGYTVTGMSDPVQAVEEYKLDYRKYDVVLLDMIMPKMNGSEVFQALRRVNHRVKAIIMTGYSDEELFAEARADGIKHFLNKPVTLTALANIVSEVLNENEQEYDK